MPDGGIVSTFTDITPSVKAAEELERANESLERRVRERTEELTRLNTELGRAKGEAEQANISKTQLAAASHDILQPLNAARLYVTSLVERQSGSSDAPLIGNIDASLDAVEEIFGALLDISRLDTGAMKPEIVSFRIDDLLRQLEVEFAPLAQEKGLKLEFVPCSLATQSDRRPPRRLLQNPPNAIVHAQGSLRLPARAWAIAHRCLRHRAWVPRRKRAIFQSFIASIRVPRWRAASASASDRGAHCPRARARHHGELGGGRGSRFSVEVLRLPPCQPATRMPRDIDRVQLPASPAVHR
jgi:hypothetical protein